MTKTAADKSNDDAGLTQAEARLFDMDTREISLVDVPANKRRLLVVKRDGSEEAVEVETSKYSPDQSRGAALADKFEITAPTAVAESQMKQELAGTPAAEETTKMSQTNSTTTPAPAAPAPAAATTAKVETPAPAAKNARPTNGDRLERLKGVQKTLKAAVAELRCGTISVEKFDSAAKDLDAVLSEVEVVKLLEHTKARKMAAGAAGFMRGSPTPNDPNMGAGVQPDMSEVAGVEAVFGEGVPAGVAALVKRLDAIEKRNVALEKKNESLQSEVVSLKKFREAPSTGDDDAHDLEAILSGGEDERPIADDEAWPTDMAAAREQELAELED